MPFYQPAPLLSNEAVNQAVDAIHKSLKGIFKDQKELIRVLENKTPNQMQQICTAYKAAHSESLPHRLEKALGGLITNNHFSTLCLQLCKPIAELDAEGIHHAISKTLGHDAEELILVLGGRSNKEIHEMKQAYQLMYKKDLDDVISGENWGKVKPLWKGLLAGARDESGRVGDVSADVAALYECGEGRWFSDASKFIEIFAKYNDNHLQAIFQGYLQKHGKPFTVVIKKEFSGELEKMMVALVELTEKPGRYYAKAFHSAMHGVGCDHHTIISLACRLREPAIMTQIKREYVDLYEKTLAARLKQELSGDYETLMMALCD